MDIKLSFLGAARCVTGSRYLLEAGGKRVLIDCGYFQEREFRDRNWDRFPAPPESIDAVLLTHAHLDHCGLLPRLVNQGFGGTIFTTSASRDIAGIILQDSARIQQEDTRFKEKRHQRENRRSPHPYEPLYTVADVETTLPLFAAIETRETFDVVDGIRAEFFDAGHILGAAHILVTVSLGGETRTILFSGDIGRWDVPLLHDPTPIKAADYVVVESTYGDRDHEPADGVAETMAAAINHAAEAGGNILIPSFAVERSQEVLYHLNELLIEKRIPPLMVFLDSPMAVRVTEVFRRHPHLFDDDTMERLRNGTHPCDFPGLKMCRTVAQSKAINQIRGSAIIVAGSGMCTGGRIKHHLARNIMRPECTILFVGYQAHGTLGRAIVDGADEVRIHGRTVPVRARVSRVGGFSGHADRSELHRWLRGLEAAPRQAFVTHGEESAAEALAEHLRGEFGCDAVVPAYQDTIALD